ncbi:MAG: biotin transporter BioY [Dialister invisus]
MHFCRLCAVCSQLTIPIQPVPITLGTFAVLLAGGFLAQVWTDESIVIYLLWRGGSPVFP